ncbi:MAG: DUF1294 domain-containing protein [Clostridia bacterium]|nr:DUF1294 domain-containing protein [Clostridia bacterium]
MTTPFIFLPAIIYFTIINLVAAIIVIYDKSISKLPRGSIRRIPEKLFINLSKVGGGVGTLLAMFTVRHKTKSHDNLLLKIAGFTLLWIVFLIIIF